MPLAQLFSGKHAQQLKNASRSLGIFAATGGVALLYFTDWKLILQYVPIIKRKFKEEE